jgi:galactokinase
MNGESLARQLVQRGLPAGEGPVKASLFDSTLRALRDLSGAPADHAWWVPGRVEVFGKHTDYAGGRSLVAAVPRGFAFVARRRSDANLSVFDARTGESLSEPASNASARWQHYVDVVRRRFARNFPGAVFGADVVFASDLPSAAGLSSSSALVVGIAATLARVADLDVRPEWQQNLQTPVDIAGYYACIENGATFGTLTGDAGVGTHGGSEDHVAIICGVPQHLSAYAFVPIRHIADVRVPDGWRFVIASSGVRAEKTGAARTAYNDLSCASAILLELWNRFERPAVSLGAAMSSDADAPDRLRRIVEHTRVEGWTARALEARLDHFVREDACVAGALAAVRDVDTRRIGELAEASQRDAETLLQNQSPGTITLVQAARELSAHAASAFGAGFGGSAWALVDDADADAFGRRWLDEYRRRCPTASDPQSFVATPGPPLTELKKADNYADLTSNTQ